MNVSNPIVRLGKTAGRIWLRALIMSRNEGS